LLMGALSGRLFGALFGVFGAAVGLEVAAPGVYSMAGAAAMLGGFTHMTLAIVALLVEATKDLSLIPILMLSISVSHVVSASISHNGYDEVLLLKKGVPYLERELPHEMEDGKLAIDLMDEFDDESILSEKPTLEVAQAALKSDDDMYPVVDEEGVCIGTVLRVRLEAAVAAHGNSGAKKDSENVPPENKAELAVIAELARRDSNQQGGVTIPVYRIMDRSPHTILEDMPVSRFYSHFSLGSIDHAVIVSNRGEFRGMVTRRNLISSAGHAHAADVPVRRSVTEKSAAGSPSAGETPNLKVETSI